MASIVKDKFFFYFLSLFYINFFYFNSSNGTLAEELRIDLDRFKNLVATLPREDRSTFTSLVASTGKLVGIFFKLFQS